MGYEKSIVKMNKMIHKKTGASFLVVYVIYVSLVHTDGKKTASCLLPWHTIFATFGRQLKCLLVRIQGGSYLFRYVLDNLNCMVAGMWHRRIGESENRRIGESEFRRIGESENRRIRWLECDIGESENRSFGESENRSFGESDFRRIGLSENRTFGESGFRRFLTHMKWDSFCLSCWVAIKDWGWTWKRQVYVRYKEFYRKFYSDQSSFQSV